MNGCQAHIIAAKESSDYSCSVENKRYRIANCNLIATQSHYCVAAFAMQ